MSDKLLEEIGRAIYKLSVETGRLNEAIKNLIQTIDKIIELEKAKSISKAVLGR